MPASVGERRSWRHPSGVFLFMTDSSPKYQSLNEVNASVSEQADAGSKPSLWQIADDFRAWVIRDLRALPDTERAGFRGDYLFIIDGSPLFLVVVTPETVSAARWDARQTAEDGLLTLAADMGDPLQLDASALQVISEGQVRVCVQTDNQTLRRLLQGTLRAKVAYLGGLVKISGDLPCFMRLVAVLKGRGVGPVRASASSNVLKD